MSFIEELPYPYSWNKFITGPSGGGMDLSFVIYLLLSVAPPTITYYCRNYIDIVCGPSRSGMDRVSNIYSIILTVDVQTIYRQLDGSISDVLILLQAKVPYPRLVTHCLTSW